MKFESVQKFRMSYMKCPCRRESKIGKGEEEIKNELFRSMVSVGCRDDSSASGKRGEGGTDTHKRARNPHQIGIPFAVKAAVGCS